MNTKYKSVSICMQIPTEPQSFEAIVKLLKNPNSYSASHHQPLKKFNVICKAIRRGGLDLNLEASAAHQAVESPKIRDIRDEIGDLERRKQSHLQAMMQYAKLQNTGLTERFEQEVDEFTQRIDRLKVQLGSLLGDSLTSLAPRPVRQG